MKKIIIGIHGLGNKPPKELLQDWWKKAIQEGLITQKINKKLPKFKLVYWADIVYSKPLDIQVKDVKDPFYLDEPYVESTGDYKQEKHTFRKKIVDFLSDQLNKVFLNDDKTLNYNFITDFILKKYFRDLDLYYSEECSDENEFSCEIRDKVRQRLANLLKKHKNCDILLVAHSMGSIITFDVLNFVLPEAKINTFVTIGSPLGLPVVIGKIASEQKQNHNDKNIMQTPYGITNKWFNLADILDHVALNYKLADDFSENENGASPSDMLVGNDYQINGNKNPHKSFGYLRTKEFATILDEFIGEEKPGIIRYVIEKLKSIIKVIFGKN